MTIAQNRSPILPLTSARFFAAAYIVLLHSVLWTNHVYTTTWTGRFLRNGYVAVGFFFVLSGYILAHVYLDTGGPFLKRKFWTSRFARVYPLLFASLLLDLPRYFLDYIHQPVHANRGKAIFHCLAVFFSESALLQAWFNTHLLAINAPSWSLSVEAFFYCVFPFVAIRIWNWSRRQGWLSILYLWGLAIFTPILVTQLRPEMFVQVETSTLQWTIMLMPIFRVFEFLAGVALCSLQREFSERVLPRARSRFGYLTIGAGIALFLLVIEVSNSIPFMAMFNGFLLPIYVLVIFGLVNIRGWLASMLSHKYMVILGESSYAVYLLHSPIYEYFSRIRPIETLPVWLLYCAAVMAASIAAFFLLERPARRLILSIARINPRIIQEEERVASES